MVKKYRGKTVGRLKAVYAPSLTTQGTPNTITITSPPQKSQYHGPSLTVSGEVQDEDLANIEIMIDGGGIPVKATLLSTGKFIARNIEILPSNNNATITAQVTHSDSSTSVDTADIVTSILLEKPQAATFDEVNNRVLLIDLDSVVAIDLATGNQSVIAKIELPNTGEFAEIAELNYTYNVTDSDYDSATNRLFFTAYENIYSINLSTQRTVKIADFDNTDYISGLIFDESRQRLIVAQRLYIEAAPYSFTTISAYNLSTKVTTTISSAFVGSGAGLSLVDKMVLNTANDTLFVFSGAQNDRKLIAVDVNPESPTYGNRTIVSDNESPGVQLGYPEYPIYDEANDRILAGDLGKGSFNDISLVDGNKDNIRLGPLAEKYIESIKPIFFNSTNNRLVALAPSLGALIEVDTSTGDTSLINSAFFTDGRKFGAPGKIAMHDISNDYFVSDRVRKTIWKIDGDTGQRTPLSSEVNNFGNTVAVDYINKNNSIIFINDSNQLQKLDLDTDQLKIIASSDKGANVSSTANFSSLTDIHYDNSKDRAIVVDRKNISTYLTSVDLTTGEKKTIIKLGNYIPYDTDVSIDRWNAFYAQETYDPIKTSIIQVNLALKTQKNIATINKLISAIHYSFNTKTVYVASFGKIKRLNLKNNKWKLISSDKKGSGAGISTITDMTLNADRTKLYATTFYGVLSIDLTTGNRVMVSK